VSSLLNWNRKFVGLNITYHNGLLSSRPPRRQFFILDPNFPRRLNESGFYRTVNFVQYLFTIYSTSGLSFDIDRDVAIYSLLKRIGKVLKTEVRYGIFRSFISSLLLWRRTYKNKTARISYGKRTVPS